MPSQNTFKQPNTEIPTRELFKRRDKLLLEAKRHYTSEGLMLSVYGKCPTRVHGGTVLTRVLLQRVVVPRDTPKAEYQEMLATLCTVVSIAHNCGYVLRARID